MSNIIDYLGDLSRPPLSLFDRFKSVPMLWRTILFVLILSSYSYQMDAFSQNPCNVKGDIPFTVDGNAPEAVCLQCGGPWFRLSSVLPIAQGPIDPACTFYAANFSMFSPLGLWYCQLQNRSPNGECETQSILADTKFCVTRISDDIFVDLLILPSPPYIANNFGPPPCNSTSLQSFLGDNSKQEKSKPDSDEFLFDGAGGDDVTLRLETDPQGGNNGGEATLAISGNSLNESTSGMPPLEINVTLPEDGQYSIIVEQPKKSSERFRGSYNLDVESSTGVDLIEPTNNVEN